MIAGFGWIFEYNMRRWGMQYPASSFLKARMRCRVISSFCQESSLSSQSLRLCPATGAAGSLDCGDLSPLCGGADLSAWGRKTPGVVASFGMKSTRLEWPRFRRQASTTESGDNRSVAQVASRRLPEGRAKRGKSPQSKALRALHAPNGPSNLYSSFCPNSSFSMTSP